MDNSLRAMRRKEIFAQINAERARQDVKWGGEEHDKHHTVAEWKNFIVEHAFKASDAAYAGQTEEVRQRFIEVAALAVAAIEALPGMATPAKVPMVYCCPVCGSFNVRTERRLNGDSHCEDCGHFAKMAAFPLVEKPSDG